MKHTLIFVLFSLFITSLYAQSPASEHTLRLDDPSNRPRASIEEVKWLAGHWKGEAFGGWSEEMWTQPAAGAMMGMYRVVRADTVWFYEFLTIVEEANSLVLRLKHFHSDLKGWETRDQTVDFPLVKIANDTAWFQGLTFKKVNQDQMTVYLRLRSGEKAWEEVFNMERVKARSDE